MNANDPIKTAPERAEIMEPESSQTGGAQAGQWVPAFWQWRSVNSNEWLPGSQEWVEQLMAKTQSTYPELVGRVLYAAAPPQAATPFPAELSSDMLPRDGGPRFRPQDGGKWISDEDFIFDAKLRIDGDWGSDEQRAKYAQAVADALNGAPPQAAPAEPTRALEFAEYMAASAERCLLAFNHEHVARDALDNNQDEGRDCLLMDALDRSIESVSEHATALRSSIYEFRKRAAKEPQRSNAEAATGVAEARQTDEQTRSQKLKAAGITRRATGKSAGGLMREDDDQPESDR